MTLQELYDWATEENATDYEVIISDNCGGEFREVEAETNYIDHEGRTIYLNMENVISIEHV